MRTAARCCGSTGLSGAVHDAQRRDARTARDRSRRPSFSNGRLYSHRHDGHRHRLRRRHRQAVLAEAGLHRGADVHDPRVLARSSTADCVIFHVGGHDKGALTAFDVNTGRAKWSWTGRRPRLRLAGRRDDWRHAPDRHDHAGEDGRRRRRDRRAALGAAVRRHQHHELAHADGVRSDGHRWRQRRSDRGATRRPQGATVGRRRQLWENADVPMRMSNGVHRRRHAVRPVDAQHGAVLRGRREDRQDAVDVGARQAAQAAIVRRRAICCSASKTTASWSFRA